MAMPSVCEHDGFVVVYDVSGHNGARADLACPVCAMEQEIKDLEKDVKYYEEIL